MKKTLLSSFVFVLLSTLCVGSPGTECRFFRVTCLEGSVPASVMISSAESGLFFLEFDTQPSCTYLIQASDELVAGKWTTVASVVGVNGHVKWLIQSGAIQILGGNRTVHPYSVKREADGSYIVVGSAHDIDLLGDWLAAFAESPPNTEVEERHQEAFANEGSTKEHFSGEAGVTVADIDGSVESGSITDVVQVAKNELSFTLKPDSGESNQAWWFYFNVTGNAQDQDVTFHIRNIDQVIVDSWDYPTYLQPVYSYDGVNWHRITRTVHSYSVFSFTQDFTQDTVSVAVSYPHTYTSLQNYLDTIDDFDFVSRENIGYSTEGRRIDLLTITEGAASNDKMVVWIVAGQHPAETSGRHVVDGLIEFLVDETDATSRRLRSGYIWKIIPMLNPDGVYAGKCRVDTDGHNLNREWDDSFKGDEIRHAYNEIRAWLENGNWIDLFLDFHGATTNDYLHTFPRSYVGSEYYGRQQRLVESFQAYTFFDRTSETTTQGTARVEMYDEFGIQAICPEVSMYNPGHTIADLRTQGAYSALAVDAYLAPSQALVAIIDSITPNPSRLAEAVSFVGHGIDSDGMVTGYNWRSNIDGQLSTSASFSTDTLSEGVHTIYFKVQDDDGAWSEEASEALTVGTMIDQSPPHVEGRAPGADEQNVPVDSNIVLHIEDSGDGVDISSIQLLVNGVLVSPQITGTASDYTLTYVPSSPFAYDSVVTTTVNAQDLHSPSNVMDEVTYSFRTQPEGVITGEWGDGTASDHPGTVEDTFININAENYAADATSLNTYTWPANSIANAILMKFDLSAIPTNATVTSASLYLYMFEAGGDPTYNISVHKIVNVNPVISAATGYTYDGSNAWTPYEGLYDNIPLGQSDVAQAEDTAAVGTVPGQKEWTITDMVSEWVANPASNRGLMLDADPNAASNAHRYFRPSEYAEASQRPRLVISYALLMDADGDGIPNDADPDDDNDGYTDTDELTNNQSDPLDADSTPPDNDGDTVSDLNDYDDDNDGMPDTWEDQFEGLDPLSDDACQDNDGDGQDNYAECVAGTDPTDAKSVFAVTELVVGGEACSLIWSSVPGKSYRVWHSYDMVAWTAVSDLIQASEGEMTNWASPIPPGDSIGCFRVEVLQ